MSCPDRGLFFVKTYAAGGRIIRTGRDVSTEVHEYHPADSLLATLAQLNTCMNDATGLPLKWSEVKYSASNLPVPMENAAAAELGDKNLTVLFKMENTWREGVAAVQATL
jgi:hypothetical protein